MLFLLWVVESDAAFAEVPVIEPPQATRRSDDERSRRSAAAEAVIQSLEARQGVRRYVFLVHVPVFISSGSLPAAADRQKESRPDRHERAALCRTSSGIRPKTRCGVYGGPRKSDPLPRSRERGWAFSL
jgi:hypothetical protein